MKKLSLLFLLVLALLQPAFAQKKYRYQSVPNDPLNARVYTLDNGLKVYLSVYRDAPRIQAAVAVRTGSKNDPHDNTGLSHYLEHMMFKGTKQAGTRDYAAEEPYLSRIEELFEKYRSLQDTTRRKAVYRVIDSISGIAAGYAIANEYDKMMAVMGAKGTNAFTGSEQTIYINEIPANQLENWLMVESDRFANPVFRIFHTELETVYEEKNMSLDSDDDKLWEALYSGLFKKHTYGTQTTLGSVEHLKNPSLKALKKYFQDRYVPNNMAICLSGDLDPDVAIALIDKTFGKFPRQAVTPFVPAVEDPVTAPEIKDVYGPDAESVVIGFRLPGEDSPEAEMTDLVARILSNGTAGLVDLNLLQAQKVLEAWVMADISQDYCALLLGGKPKDGQTLDQVREELLGQVELVKNGDFPDWLLPAVVTDMKLKQVKRFESNMGRCMALANSFILDNNWEQDVQRMARLEKITKQDLVAFAGRYFGNNYVAVNKKTGEDRNVQKVMKPAITPVEMNRDAQSGFAKKVAEANPEPVSPVFLDFKKDIRTLKIQNDLPMIYLGNKENNTFNLYYLFDMGTNHDRRFGVSMKYLNFLGTSKLKPAAFKQELYKSGCSLSFFASEDQIWVSLSGLSENMEKGLLLFESLLSDPVAEDDALKNLVSDILKSREDDKKSKNTILWSAMYNFGQYGPASPFTNILSEKELQALTPSELITQIRSLNAYPHRVMYYGTHSPEQVKSLLASHHKVPAALKPVPGERVFTEQENLSSEVYVIDYDMKQVEILMLSKSEKYDKDVIPSIRIFNEYFGGSMASIVFQELREARALAYSAMAGYRGPSRPDRSNFVYAYIGTQNDKLPEAMKNMMALFNDMPESQRSFKESREAVINKIRTERITKTRILFNYDNARKFGLDYDLRKDVFEKVPDMTFADLKSFEEKYMKNRNFNIMVLGKKDQLDLNVLEQYGKVRYLTLDQVFGY